MVTDTNGDAVYHLAELNEMKIDVPIAGNRIKAYIGCQVNILAWRIRRRDLHAIAQRLYGEGKTDTGVSTEEKLV